MKKAVLYYIIFCAVFAASIHSQDLRENITRSLFSDNKATKPGDAITILVLEVNSATNGATTSTQRTSDLSLSANGSATGIGNVPAFDANFGLGTNNSFTGGGSVSSRGDVRARISATVDSIYSNGNLHIIGRRTISIAGEDQIIDISGIVRPSDIQADNSVLSSNISDAVISFSGSGMVERSQEPGWLTKIFHWIF